MVVLEVKMYSHVGVSVTVLSKRHFGRRRKSVSETNTSINVSLCANVTISLSVSRFSQRACNDGGVSSCV